MANELEIILRARNETAKAFDQLGTQQENLVKTVTKMTAQLFSVAAAAKLATSALKAQAEQEAAINQLNLALANQGRFTRETSKALQEYASHLQETTTFADDAVLAAEGLLASFGQNEAQIKATTSAAADFAAATNTDLRTAAELLGKAFVGSTGALSRYGIVVDENVSKSEKFNAALAQVQQRFGGSAAAQTATYTGAMSQLKNQFGEVMEALGKLLGELSGSGAPFSILIDAAKRTSTFIGSDLVKALYRARAGFADFLAGAIEASDVDGMVQKLKRLADPGKFLTEFVGRQRAGQGVFSALHDALGGDTAANQIAKDLRGFAEELRTEGDKIAEQAGRIRDVINKPPSGRAAGATKEEVEQARKEADARMEIEIAASKATGDALFDNMQSSLKKQGAAWKVFFDRREKDLAEQTELDKKEVEVFIAAQQSKQEMAEKISQAILEAQKRRAEETAEAWAQFADNVRGVTGLVQEFGLAAESNAARVADSIANAADLIARATQRGYYTIADLANAASGIMKSGSALGGAASGAMIGTSIAPGIGTVIGGIAGGILGLFGGGKKKKEEEQRKAVEAQNKALEEQRKRIEALTTAMGGLDLMAKGVTASTQDGFDRLGRYAVAAFSAFIKQTGDIFGALEKLGPSLDSLISKQKEYGFTVSAAFQRLLDLRNVVTANKDVADSISGLNQLMKSFGEAGVTNGALFQDFAADAGALYNTLIARGTDANAAIGLMQPTLQQLWEQQKKYGAVTDESTAALLRQAEQQGLVGAQFQSVNEKILDVLLAIGEVLGAKIPDALRRMGETASDVYGGMISDAQRYAQAGSGGYGGSNSYTPGLYTGPPPEQYAAGSGGIRDFGRGTPATLHGREGVFTEGQITALIAAARGGGRPIVIQGTGLSKEDLAWAMDRALKNDERGLKTRVRRITKGRD